MSNNINYCGIDFGTSNSTLGLFIDGEAQLVNLEHNHNTIPSAIFYEEDSKEITFGRQALDYYRNGYDGRLLRSFKSILGSSLMKETTQINDESICFSEVIETFLKHLKETAEKKHNVQLDNVVIGRPIHFVDDDKERDNAAQKSLLKAAKNVGFKKVKFQYEPIAASLKYEASLDDEKLVLIVDIGGGTSDISIVKLSPKKALHKDRAKDCLANMGIHIGGTDFDTNLSLQNIMPLLGYKKPLKKNGMHIPNHFYTTLSTWYKINFAYSLKYSLGLQSLKNQLIDLTCFDRLEKVVDERHGFSLAMITEEAKIHLSNMDLITQDLDFIETGLNVEFSKEDLSEAINRQIKGIIKTTDACIKKAKLKSKDIDSIFLTGGSSQMAIIKEKISEHYKDIPIDNQDALSSVATGLVIEAQKQFG